MQRKDVFLSAISKRHWLGMSFVDLFLRWRVVVLTCRCVCVPLRCHCSLVVSLACRFAGRWTVVALACRCVDVQLRWRLVALARRWRVIALACRFVDVSLLSVR